MIIDRDEVGFFRAPWWAIVLLALTAVHGWMVRDLFGGDSWRENLLNDQFVLDGRHPLHYYHGLLGYRSWHESGSMSCYDPSFQAGYLKTPVFDAGSRPAELFFLIGGPSPSTYKIGLAIGCLLVPAAFAWAGRGAGMRAGGACLSAMVGSVFWWSPPGRSMLEAGDLDLLFGGMCVPIYLTWIARYCRGAGPIEWLTLMVSSAIGWYLQPVIMLGLVVISLGVHAFILRSQGVYWHLGLLSANAVGFLINLGWLRDWARHIWMYVPFGGEQTPQELWPTTVAEWKAFLPSEPIDLGLVGVGIVGFLFMQRRRAGAAWLLILGAAVFVAVGGFGRLSPIIAEFGLQKLMSVGLWCFAVPASYALYSLVSSFGVSVWARLLGTVSLVAGVFAITLSLDLTTRWRTHSLMIGLENGRQDIVRTVRELSHPEGRVLWEDRNDVFRGSGWTALLAELTQRPFLGGLTNDWCLDYSFARLAEGRLCGRPIAEWSDVELERFFQRYNVTRIVCWNSDSVDRLMKYPNIRRLAEFKDGEKERERDGEADGRKGRNRGVMFALDRRPTFVLSGKATLTQLDWKRVALSDLEPDENGTVTLSLHYHKNWRATPSYIQIERDKDIDDPISLIRIRVPSPVARMNLVWKTD